MVALELPLTSTGPHLLRYISWREIVCPQNSLTTSVSVRRSHLQFFFPGSRNLDDKQSQFCMRYCLSCGYMSNNLCVAAGHRIPVFGQKTEIVWHRDPMTLRPNCSFSKRWSLSVSSPQWLLYWMSDLFSYDKQSIKCIFIGPKLDWFIVVLETFRIGM